MGELQPKPMQHGFFLLEKQFSSRDYSTISRLRKQLNGLASNTHLYPNVFIFGGCVCLLSAVDTAQGYQLSPLHPTSGLLVVFPSGPIFFYFYCCFCNCFLIQTSKKLNLLPKRKTATELRLHVKII